MPWINLDTDSSLIRLESTDFVSCAVNGHQTWGDAVIRFQTTNSSGDDGFGQQVIELTVIYYNSGAATFHLKTNAGSGYQEHPFYWNVAPCNVCSSSDGSDDALVVDASLGSGANNKAEQRGETQWDEMPHQLWVYWVYDEVCFQFSCEFNSQMQFWAESFQNGGTAYYSKAWALQCTACGDAQYSQYTNGPWDYLNNQVTWDVDVQIVIIMYRNVEPGGGWTSEQALTSD